MIEFFLQGGTGMWFFLLIVIAQLYMAVRSFSEVSDGDKEVSVVTENRINGVLFWGSIAFVLGYFWHFLGLYYAAEAMTRASDISPAIVAGGYRMSLITVLTGQLIFVVSAVVWFLLRSKYKTRIKAG